MKKGFLIVGVRLDRRPSSARFDALARLGVVSGGAANGGDATYVRLGDAAADRRLEPRRSAHLRWGKALDERDRFLCDCIIGNRTPAGACVKITRNVAIAKKFQLYEDDSSALYEAYLVWRRGTELGCRLSREATHGKERVILRMRSAYYAL